MTSQFSALFTDLYELTMMQVWFSSGSSKKKACFDLFFRENPFHGGYCVACGITDALGYLTKSRISADEISYLRSLGQFEEEFLLWLTNWKFSGNVTGVPEGKIVFPGEPILRVEGDLLSCQLVETFLLNIINFQSLIATKATRISDVAGWDRVMEFGARRAQGQDGALSASRAAYIGGCIGTSNVYAGKKFGIPVKGTHAHSFVMSYPDELEAFQTFVKVYPEGAVLLIDTYDTISSGLVHAITVAKEMENEGKMLAGIRLDSGNLLSLTKECRRILDREGLSYVKIVVSGDLDEYILQRLLDAGAPIDMAGIGTRLVTGYDSPAMTGVYKLAAVTDDTGLWHSVLKLTNQEEKRTTPGIKQVWRVSEKSGRILMDIIETEGIIPDKSFIMSSLIAHGFTLEEKDIIYTPLLNQLITDGVVISDTRVISQIRDDVREDIMLLDASIRDLKNPARYPCIIGQQITSEILSLSKKLACSAASGWN